MAGFLLNKSSYCQLLKRARIAPCMIPAISFAAVDRYLSLPDMLFSLAIRPAGCYNYCDFSYYLRKVVLFLFWTGRER